MNDNMKKNTNCPNCSSNNISLDIKLGKLKCNYCGQVIEDVPFEKEEIIINHEADKTKDNTQVVSQESVNQLVNLKCTKCGEKMVGNKNNYPTTCPWCYGKIELDPNPSVINVVNILPFSVTKDEAIEKMQKNMKKKRHYTSKAFLKNFNPEKIIGTYLPYPMLNAECVCDFEGYGYHEIDIHCDDDNVTYSVAEHKLRRVFEVTTKEFVLEKKDETITNKEVLIDNIITASMPYDTENKELLDSKYLDGFLAGQLEEKTIEENEQLCERLQGIGKYAIFPDISYYNNGVRWEKEDVTLKQASYENYYLPVWLYTYNENNKQYYVAANGRTNEIVFHIPFNKTRAMITSLLKGLLGSLLVLLVLAPIAAIVAGVAFGIVNNLSNISVIASAIVLFIVTIATFIVGTSTEYKTSKLYYLGDNIIGENDCLHYDKLNVIERNDEFVRRKTVSDSDIKGRNDGFTRKRTI